MSQQLISHSHDLKQLRDEGYDIEVRSALLLVKDVPYIGSDKEIKKGILVSKLTLNGDSTGKPDDHVAYFIGQHPCYQDGSEIYQIKHQSGDQSLDNGLIVQHSFSSKPLSGAYQNYHEKMVTYANIISAPARSIDQAVTPQTFPVIESSEDESVFNYYDTSSSRAGINAITSKLALSQVAIVGLGGTGSYILDLIAKTPINSIHIFDGDTFSNHNAFRSPGAPTIEELRAKPKKVEYFHQLYAKMRRNIIPHECYINEGNIEQLDAMDFVFLCLDKSSIKAVVIAKLEERNIPFIDVGMGVELVDGALTGLLRVTTSTPEKREHVRDKSRIPLTDGAINDEYSSNIQIADLNALNATLAVIRWKKMFGFYHDLEREHFSTYAIDGNILTNEELQ